MLLKYSILLLLLSWMSISEVIPNKSASTLVANLDQQISVIKPATLVFDKDVKPIFEQHCNPCHFPGGKMYDRLPFDQAMIIISQEEGILKRIKEPAEVNTIRQFVEQNARDSKL